MFSFGLIVVRYAELSNFWGALHLRSAIGGFAYGISSQLTTPLFMNPLVIPDVVCILNSLPNKCDEVKIVIAANINKYLMIFLLFQIQAKLQKKLSISMTN